MKLLHVKSFLIVALSLLLVLLISAGTTATLSVEVEETLFELLKEQGEAKPLHYIENIDPALAIAGEGIVKKGHAHWPDGSRSRRQSKYFVCTDCHNVEQEDPVLSNADPETRLQFAFERGLPFLQGTTFWGMVNREKWYNGDYYKKYGDLVTNTRDTLVNAIQLCATVCSQGHELGDKEMEAILHYFWSLQLMVGDIGMSQEDEEKLIQDELDPEQKRAIIKSYYMTASPARFVDPVPKSERQYGVLGNASKGKVIYEQGCMHCHDPARNITNLGLEDATLSFRLLKKKLSSTSDLSVYEMIRKGTEPIAGYRPYMPHYTLDRMSDQQIEDLVAYIKQQAKKQ